MSGYMYSPIGPEENSTWIKIHLLKGNKQVRLRNYLSTGIQKRHAMGKKPILVTLEEFQDLKKHLEVRLAERLTSHRRPSKIGVEIPRKLSFCVGFGGWFKGSFFVEGFFDVGAAGICWFLIYLSGSLLPCTKEGAAWRQRISQNRSKSLGWYRMIYFQKFKIDTRNWPCMAILKKESPFPNRCEFSMVYVTSSHKKRFDAPNLAWHMGDQ